MAEYQEACEVAKVLEGRGLTVEVRGLAIAIFNNYGEFHALLNRCPHANGSMGQGWIEEGEAVCPLHMWRFRLKDGRCSTMKGASLHRFPCEIRGDKVWVAV